MMDEYFWAEMHEKHPDWTDEQILEYAGAIRHIEKPWWDRRALWVGLGLVNIGLFIFIFWMTIKLSS